MSDPKYAYPYPAHQGYYQGPPVMAPPQYYAAPPPRREVGFLEGWFLLLFGNRHLTRPVISADESDICTYQIAVQQWTVDKGDQFGKDTADKFGLWSVKYRNGLQRPFLGLSS
ncbi:hypothetical protein SAY86_029675 [Trapa natans]|uniref:Uncharacterized protein n=1 Tax=Trapa natans TaxID=22666 RepID=A0AAN7M2K2_TRANT|nr:hypothetical protein SAY86_029675 [Trapa natans]